jgi:hypothetical protein
MLTARPFLRQERSSTATFRRSEKCANSGRADRPLSTEGSSESAAGMLEGWTVKLQSSRREERRQLSTGVARCSSNGEDVHARLMVGKAHKHHTQQIRCPEGAELGAYWRDAPRAASSQRFMAANVS